MHKYRVVRNAEGLLPLRAGCAALAEGIRQRVVSAGWRFSSAIRRKRRWSFWPPQTDQTQFEEWFRRRCACINHRRAWLIHSSGFLPDSFRILSIFQELFSLLRFTPHLVGLWLDCLIQLSSCLYNCLYSCLYSCL